MSIIVLTLFIVFIKKIIQIFRRNFKIFLVAIILSFIISLPAILSFNTGQVGRLKVFSIFSYPRSSESIDKLLGENDEQVGDVNYVLFHSEALNYVRVIIGKYANHFSSSFLLFEGDYQNPKHSAPNQGMLQLFDLMLLPIGFISLIRSKGKYKIFVFMWLILSPLPAVLTRDLVQGVRAYNMAIPLTLVSTFGLFETFRFSTNLKTKNKNMFFATTAGVVVIFLGSIIYFLDVYFVHMPIHNAKYWNYGYREVIKTLLPIQNKYKTVYFQQSYDQPYIYYLFYSVYDPAAYQTKAKLSNYLGPDVGLVDQLDNINFFGWSWPFATGEKSTIIIGNDVAIPSDYNKNDYNLISEIKFPDHFMTAFRILETKLHE